MPDHVQGEYVISKQNLNSPPPLTLPPHCLSHVVASHSCGCATLTECLALPRPHLDANKLAFDDKKGVES